MEELQEVYKTIDGKLFERRRDAEIHEHKVLRKREKDNFIKYLKKNKAFDNYVKYLQKFDEFYNKWFTNLTDYIYYEIDHNHMQNILLEPFYGHICETEEGARYWRKLGEYWHDNYYHLIYNYNF